MGSACWGGKYGDRGGVAAKYGYGGAQTTGGIGWNLADEAIGGYLAVGRRSGRLDGEGIAAAELGLAGGVPPWVTMSCGP